MTPPRSQTRSTPSRTVRSAKPAAAATPPRGEGRVLIEGVSPEIDAGASPAKRVVGESFEVQADIFTDGHDVIRAELLYRRADEIRWRRAPMHFVENDRWSGSFVLDANTRWLFTIEGWRDPFASWSTEVRKKHQAGQDISTELAEGRTLIAGVDPNGADAAAMPGCWRPSTTRPATRSALPCCCRAKPAASWPVLANGPTCRATRGR